LRRARKPVIASVHGAVAGAGMSIMMACDMIIAAEGTQFNMAYSRIATSPDGGATWFLPRLAGYHKAMEMFLLAESVDARALHALGIVNRVVPAADLHGATLKLAQRLAAGPATAFAETKALVNSELNQILKKHLDAEAYAFSRCAAHADFAEGVTAFVDKRTAVFGHD
jgi:2-(1,2-epoxy-1,2-dihydrophenyl)acetyl-CoA isomerase